MTKQQQKIKIEWALKIFRKAVLFYVEYLGLKDWEWHIDTAKGENYRAHNEILHGGRISEVFLSESWIIDSEPSEHEIRMTAFHEVAESLLAELRNLCEKTFSYNKVDTEIHKIIRVLENTLFKEIQKNAKDN